MQVYIRKRPTNVEIYDNTGTTVVEYAVGNAENINNTTLVIREGNTVVKTYLFSSIQLYINSALYTDIEYTVGYLNNQVFLTTPDGGEEEVIYKGDWSASPVVPYSLNNEVSYNDGGTIGLYICILAPTANQNPTNTTYWKKIATIGGGGGGGGLIPMTLAELQESMLGTVTFTYYTDYFYIWLSPVTTPFQIGEIITEDTTDATVEVMYSWTDGSSQALWVKELSGSFAGGYSLSGNLGGQSNTSFRESNPGVFSIGDNISEWLTSYLTATVTSVSDGEAPNEKIVTANVTNANGYPNITSWQGIRGIYVNTDALIKENSLTTTGGLIAGQKYLITDVPRADLGVIVTATSDHTIADEASGGFLNADWLINGNYTAIENFNQNAGQWETEKLYFSANPIGLVEFKDPSSDPFDVGYNVDDTMNYSGNQFKILSKENKCSFDISNISPGNAGAFSVGHTITGTDTAFTGTITKVVGSRIYVDITAGNPYTETELTDDTTSDTADVDEIYYYFGMEIISGAVTNNYTYTDNSTSETIYLTKVLNTDYKLADHFVNDDETGDGYAYQIQGGQDSDGNYISQLVVYLRNTNGIFNNTNLLLDGSKSMKVYGSSYIASHYYTNDVVIAQDQATDYQFCHWRKKNNDVNSVFPSDDNGTYWEKLPRNVTNGYIVEWRSIIFDAWAANGYYNEIVRQWDKYGNDVNTQGDVNTMYPFVGFPWGYIGIVEGNTIGIYSQFSIRGKLNFIAGNTFNCLNQLVTEIDSRIGIYNCTLQNNVFIGETVKLKEGIYGNLISSEINQGSHLILLGTESNPYCYPSQNFGTITVNVKSTVTIKGNNVINVGDNYYQTYGDGSHGELIIPDELQTTGKTYTIANGKSNIELELDPANYYDSATKTLTLPENWYNSVGIIRLTATPSDKIEKIDFNMPYNDYAPFELTIYAATGESVTFTPTAKSGAATKTILDDQGSDIILSGGDLLDQADYITISNSAYSGNRINRIINKRIII